MSALRETSLGHRGLALAARVASAVLLASACRRAPSELPEVRVACAADAAPVVEALLNDPTGPAQPTSTSPAARTTVVAGASGVLAKQLVAGAPFHVFVSAGPRFVDEVVAAGACDGATRRAYAVGALSVVRRRTGRPFGIDDLGDPSLVRIALADPEHAPYGRAAAEALAARGLAPRLEGRLVRAGDVRQALELVLAGGADAALVARSLARARAAELDVGDVPPALHAPLRQELVVCAGTVARERAAAERIAARLTSDEARRAFVAAGFDPTGPLEGSSGAAPGAPP